MKHRSIWSEVSGDVVHEEEKVNLRRAKIDPYHNVVGTVACRITACDRTWICLSFRRHFGDLGKERGICKEERRDLPDHELSNKSE